MDEMLSVGNNASLEAQVMNVSPNGCYNPLAHFTHVSTGTFRCGSCDKDHLRVTLKLTLTELGGQEIILNLVDEDAASFVSSVTDLLAEPSFKAGMS